MRRALGLFAVAATATLFACLAPGCSSKDQPPPAPSGPAGALETATGARWVVETDPVTGAPSLAAPLSPISPVAVNGVTRDQAARAFLAKFKDIFRLADPTSELALVEELRSSTGTGHVRYVQTEGGFYVDQRTVTVHFLADGSIAMINGRFLADAAKAVASPKLDAPAALAAAEADIPALVPSYARTALRIVPVPKLVLFPSGSGAILAWAFDLAGSAGNGSFAIRYRVDAQSGAVLQHSSQIESVTGSGVGVNGDTKSIEVTRKPRRFLRWPQYRMIRAGTGSQTEIDTHDASNGNVIIESSDLHSWEPNVAAGAKGAAVDAHANMATVDRFYRSAFGYASYDGRGSTLNSFVHDNSDEARRLVAFFDSSTHEMHFIDEYTYPAPLGTVKASSAALDVSAHEFTHGVTDASSGLPNDGEAGGISESISDVFGTFVEHASPPQGSSIFDLGEAIISGGLRNMQNPKSKSTCGGGGSVCPDHWSLVDANSDTHDTCNVSNNAWYLMTFGGTNATSNIPVTNHLDWDTSRALWWDTERQILHPGETFKNLAEEQTAWANNHGYDVAAVGCAWVAVGLLDVDWMKNKFNVQCYCPAPDGGVLPPEQLECCDAGASDQCCKQCADAGATPDGGAADGGAPTTFDLVDSCRGRADGTYCSVIAPYSAILCKNESIAAGEQCANDAKCLGPNGPGPLQCEGQAPAGGSSGSSGSSGNPPPPPPPIPDSCDGRADGLYCSVITPGFAIQCKAGSTAGGLGCPTGQMCIGPNGPGTDIQCQ